MGDPLHGQGTPSPWHPLGTKLGTPSPVDSCPIAECQEGLSPRAQGSFFLGPGPRGLGAAFFLGSPVRLETRECWGARRPRPGLTPAVRPADPTPRGRLFCGNLPRARAVRPQVAELLRCLSYLRSHGSAGPRQCARCPRLRRRLCHSGDRPFAAAFPGGCEGLAARVVCGPRSEGVPACVCLRVPLPFSLLEAPPREKIKGAPRGRSRSRGRRCHPASRRSSCPFLLLPGGRPGPRSAFSAPPGTAGRGRGGPRGGSC